MENKIFNHSTIRKRKPRENETSEHCQECIVSNVRKIVEKNGRNWDVCHACECERKCLKLASEINQQCERRLENNRYIRTIKRQQFQALESQQDQINVASPLLFSLFVLWYKECFSSIVLIQGNVNAAAKKRNKISFHEKTIWIQVMCRNKLHQKCARIRHSLSSKSIVIRSTYCMSPIGK